jgi:hypothetical protein
MIALLLVLVLPLASSSIFIEPLNTVYNLGDQINAETKLISTTNVNSHYTVDLKCGDYNSNIFNNFISAQANVEKPITVSTQLSDASLESITAQCNLIAKFNGEEVSSSAFSLSKLINIDAQTEFDHLNPGENLHVSGTATEESGNAVNGFVELFVPAINLYKSGVVTNGAFDIVTPLPMNAKGGEHDIRIDIHNTDSNSRKINLGSYSSKITISQKLKELNIKLNSDTAKPQEDFTFKVEAIDQAGDTMAKDVTLVINKPQGVPFVKKIIRSGEDQNLKFALSDTPGYWSIETEVDSIKARKLFYLSEVNTLQTSLIDNTIIITNIGNAPYVGPVEISIGSVVEVKQVNLNAGETQKFTLRAPDGDYKITTSSEDGEVKELGTAFLTGNAVKVSDFKEDVIYTFTNPLIWWLAVALLVLIVILVQVKIRMNRIRGHSIPSASGSMNMMAKPISIVPRTEFSPNTRSTTDLAPSKTKFDMSWFEKPKVVPSQQSVNPFVPATPKVNPNVVFGSTQGIRERAAAIALYVNTVNPNVNETINRALSLARETGAKIYLDGEYKVILFSPRLTQNQDNELVAINVARRIQALFLEHMSMTSDGATFGLGVSDGEIISEIENGKFHFTSTGNLISYAKRLAHASNTKLLLSDSIRRKVITTVKTEKAPYQGVWEVVKVTDYSPSKDFIKRFSDRNN